MIMCILIWYIYSTPSIFCNHISVADGLVLHSIIFFSVLCDDCHLSVLQSWPRPLQVAIDHGKLWTFYKANSDRICSFLFKCGIPWYPYPIRYHSILKWYTDWSAIFLNPFLGDDGMTIQRKTVSAMFLDYPLAPMKPLIKDVQCRHYTMWGPRLR